MSQIRILIVTNTVEAELLLVTPLERLGYAVPWIVGNGKEALLIVERELPDLVLMDARLAAEVSWGRHSGQPRALSGCPLLFFCCQPYDRAFLNGEIDLCDLLINPQDDHELDMHIAAALYRHGHERRLHEVEEMQRGLLETCPDCIMRINLHGGFLEANPPALRVFGVESLKALQAGGRTFFESVVSPAWLSGEASLLEALQRSSPLVIECSLQVAGSGAGPAEAALTLLRDAAGKPCAVLVVWRDVRERRQEQAQLRKLTEAVEQSADSIMITDIEGRIEYVNPSFERATGYSREQVMQRTPGFLNSGEHDQAFFSQLWQTVLAGKSWRGELQNRRKDGSLFWENSSIAPVLGADGVITNFIMINKDITERKQLEQALRIKDSAIASSINAIALADLSGKMTYANPAFLSLWGYPAVDEVLGRSVGVFWQDDAHVEQVIDSLMKGTPWRGELPARRKDGSAFVLDVSAHLVLDELSQPLCLMSSFVDITARKKAEAAEKEQRNVSEALRRTAEALSSSLNLADVLESIMENADKVIPSDSTTILLLDGESLLVAGHRGNRSNIAEFHQISQYSLSELSALKVMKESRSPLIIPNTAFVPAQDQIKEGAWIKSYAGAPICRGEQVLGFLNMGSGTAGFYSEAYLDRLQVFASQAAMAIENARLYEKDHYLSITDGLTGLYNSRYFFEIARLEFERYQRTPGDLSVVMVDVDHFKEVNDHYGHMVGDDVLRELARRVQAGLRVVDLAARYGGEEFVILMGRTNHFEACQVADRIRLAVADAPFEVPDGLSVAVTVSLGVATLDRQHTDFNMLVKNADDALYQAKNAGRNQYAAWPV
jgi:diguanylate cyclase (GGDEF)-like protein/PAS domain S-box-containing protein